MFSNKWHIINCINKDNSLDARLFNLRGVLKKYNFQIYREYEKD